MKSYAEFEIKDYRFIAFGPDSDRDALQWEIVLMRGGMEVRREVVPMNCWPRFAVDAEDVFARDAAVEKIIAEMELEE